MTLKCGCEFNYGKSANDGSISLFHKFCELHKHAEEMRDICREAMGKPDEIIEIMRKHDLKIDDMDDPMQKLCFTIYTDLVSIAEKSKRVLEDIVNNPEPG